MDINFHQLEHMAINGAPENILIDFACLQFHHTFGFALVEAYLPESIKDNTQQTKDLHLDHNLIALCDKAIEHEQSLLTTDEDNNCIFITPLFPRHLKHGAFIFFKTDANILIDRNQIELLVKKFCSILEKTKIQSNKVTD